MKKILILLPFSILLFSCSRQSKDLNFKERCKHVQNIIEKTLENYSQMDVIQSRRIAQYKKVTKLGEEWIKDPTYNSINDIYFKLKNKGKKIEKEKNKAYQELFLVMGLDKKSVLKNMKLVTGGEIMEKNYNKSLGIYNDWLTYTSTKEYKIAKDWYSENRNQTKDFCNEFGIDLLKPYENFSF